MDLKSGIVVDLPVSGICVTRNGESPICRMIVKDNGAERLSIRFVSGKLKRSLHSGADIGSREFDAICLAWLHARGYALNGAECEPDERTTKALKMLKTAEEALKVAQISLGRKFKRLH